MYDFNDFQKLVSDYARVYSKFEKMQKEAEFIPEKGDQKTGLIGEAYIYEYLSKSKCKKLGFGNHSEKGWDIECSNGKYQVKTVSHYSDTQKVSPIHEGWDFLYLVHLNEKFVPDRILKIENPGNWNNNVIKGLKFPISKQTIILNGKTCTIIDETDKFKKLFDL